MCIGIELLKRIFSRFDDIEIDMKCVNIFFFYVCLSPFLCCTAVESRLTTIKTIKYSRYVSAFDFDFYFLAQISSNISLSTYKLKITFFLLITFNSQNKGFSFIVYSKHNLHVKSLLRRLKQKKNK